MPDTSSWSADKTIATLDDIPTVPTTVSSFTNDAGYITGITSSMVTTALGYTPGTSNFSGDYDDLTNKPSIPTATSDLTNDSGFITINDIPVTDVEVNGTSVVAGGIASVSVPINVSDLANDAGYITSSALSSYSTTSQMNTAISTAISNQTKET